MLILTRCKLYGNSLRYNHRSWSRIESRITRALWKLVIEVNPEKETVIIAHKSGNNIGSTENKCILSIDFFSENMNGAVTILD